MSLSESIGGYFELELNDLGTVYHDDALMFNSGRNALRFIIEEYGYKHIYVPYYSCDAVFKTIKACGIKYSFYAIDDTFSPTTSIHLEENDAILYINYYGICTQNVKIITERFKNCIIDNSQAFYEIIPDNKPTFYSPRKFFGVPSGGFAYSNDSKENYEQLLTDNDIDIFDHLIERIEVGTEFGYASFVKSEQIIEQRSVNKMSALTFKLMRNIDYSKINLLRNKNFDYVHQMLGSENELRSFINESEFNVPMIYPFLRTGNDKLKSKLVEQQVYTATYWPDIIKWMNVEGCHREKYLVQNLIAFPIDQRMDKDRIDQVIELITHTIHGK